MICILLVLVTGICVKYRRYRALRAKARQSPSLGHLTGTQRSQGEIASSVIVCYDNVNKINCKACSEILHIRRLFEKVVFHRYKFSVHLS